MKKVIFLGLFLLTSSVSASDVMCTMEYAPVCASQQVQCFTTPCEPIQQTFGNKCMMAASNATYLYDGECKTDDTGSTDIMCTMEYAPVCGSKNGQQNTYGNKCMLGAQKASYLYDGECSDNSSASYTAEEMLKLSNYMNNYFAKYQPRYYRPIDKVMFVRQIKDYIRRQIDITSDTIMIQKLSKLNDMFDKFVMDLYSGDTDKVSFAMDFSGTKSFNVTLDFPTEFKGKYKMITGDNYIRFDYFSGDMSDTIFGINIFDSDQWQQQMQDGLLNLNEIGDKDGYTFAYFTALDNPFTGLSMQEFSEFVAKTSQIIKTIVIK